MTMTNTPTVELRCDGVIDASRISVIVDWPTIVDLIADSDSKYAALATIATRVRPLTAHGVDEIECNFAGPVADYELRSLPVGFFGTLTDCAVGLCPRCDTPYVIELT